jgi:hypothetical protein
VINRKRTFHLYQAERLAVRPRHRRRLPERERVWLVVPQQYNQRWSMDFPSNIVENRAPLSRWRPDYAKPFDGFSRERR